MTAKTLAELQSALQQGRLSAEQLVQDASAKAEQSPHVFIECHREAALAKAKAVDLARQRGQALPPYAGIPLSLKDLFDQAQQVTRAGSKVLATAPVAQADAPVVARLKAAGFIALGRVNMSEFAFSGMGVNPHYGTPLSVWDRETGRLPGGSSSGSAVSVAEQIVPASIGSDTAGSCRIPAAFNGIVGFKPSYGRLPLQGAYPLSPTMDAPGPLAHSVACCAALDAIMADGQAAPLSAAKRLSEIHLCLPQTSVMQALDHQVSEAFGQALEQLRRLGVKISECELPELDALLEIFAQTPIAAYEAQRAHRDRLQSHGDDYDPFVRWRLDSGVQIQQSDYQRACQQRQQWIQQLQPRIAAFDALIYPTVAVVPPALSETEDFDNARAVNFRCLRNTATVNYFDGCSISLPCHRTGQAPVGLMLSAGHGRDRALLALAQRLEQALAPVRH